jgi:rod shape-determining protein MreC
MTKALRLLIIFVILIWALIWLPPLKSLKSTIQASVLSTALPFRVIGSKTYEYYSIAITLKDILSENERSKLEIDDLRSQITSLQEVAHENTVLREQLALAPNESPKPIVASVIGVNPSDFYSILINKGIKDGVSKGKPVLSNGFLIGVVQEVDDRSAAIELITSHRTRLAVKLQGSRVLGLLHGGIRGITVEDIPIDVQITNGEMVVTAGQSNIRPGIPIGSIDQVLSSKSDIYQQLLIKSPIAFRSLDTVFVDRD